MILVSYKNLPSLHILNFESRVTHLGSTMALRNTCKTIPGYHLKLLSNNKLGLIDLQNCEYQLRLNQPSGLRL